jgi:hypothetical protein
MNAPFCAILIWNRNIQTNLDKKNRGIFGVLGAWKHYRGPKKQFFNFFS